MDLKGACLAVAQEALKPPHLFDANSQIVVKYLDIIAADLQSRSSVNPTVAEYVFFPVRSLLQQDKLCDRAVELIFRVVSLLCTKSWSNESFLLERAQQLIAVTSFLLSPEPPISTDLKPSSKFLEKSGSYRAAGFGCFAAIFRASGAAGFAEELGRSPAIAEIIAMLLNGIQYDLDNLEAQKNSLDALDLIFQKLIRNRDHRALVLPRVVSKLTKFLNVSNKRHFSAKVTALNVLTDVLVLTLDSETEISSVMTSEWLETTMENLQFTFTTVKNLLSHILELTGTKIGLLNACFEFGETTLGLDISEKCRKEALAIVVMCASQSIDDSLSSNATRLLENLPKTTVESVLAEQLRALPQLLTTMNDSYGVSELNSLQIVFKLLGESDAAVAVVDVIESSLPVSIRGKPAVEDAIQTVVQLDKYSGSSEYIDLESLGLKIGLPSAVQASLVGLLSIVGAKSHKTLVPLILERLQECDVSLQSVTLLWVLGAVLRGVRELDVYDTVTYCFENLTQSLELYEEISSPARFAHSAMCCFVIGESALIEGSSFKELLVDLVHPLFATLGNTESLIVREQCGIAIAKVAHACGYSSPQELAVDNKDYLVDGISLQLNTLNIAPGTFRTLISLIHISGPAILVYLDDIFRSLFILLDKFHGYTSLLKGILGVFGALTSVVSRSTKLPELIEYTKKDGGFENLEEVLSELQRKPELDPSIVESLDLNVEESFEKIEKSMDPDADLEMDEEEESLDKADAAVTEWKFPIAKPTYEIIQKIAGYCDRLMTHETAEIRMATLVLITPLVPFLAVNKEEFLPLVHKTWPEAVSRALDSEAFVVEQALKCLSAITSSAREFVGARIDALWPKLEAKYRPLIQQKWPQFAPERRVVDALASFVQVAVESIDVSLATLESILVAFRPSLLRKEHSGLYSSVDKRRAYGDLLWLVLLDHPVEHEGVTVEPVYHKPEAPKPISKPISLII